MPEVSMLVEAYPCSRPLFLAGTLGQMYIP
jgi:hypothetical protein